MLIRCIVDAERDVSMKNLSIGEAVKILEDMKVKIEIPKAAVTQWERNAALDMAIESLSCSESPNSSDLISRQAALDGVKTLHDVAWKNWHEPTLSANVVLDMIGELPSAQPEPCNFCKHNDVADDVICLRCPAERREDGKTT